MPGQLAADRGMPFICVQPMVTSRERRTEDRTFDEADEKDAVLIVRLLCYVRKLAGEVLGGVALRHLDAVVTTDQRQDPDIAAHGTRRPADPPIVA